MEKLDTRVPVLEWKDDRNYRYFMCEEHAQDDRFPAFPLHFVNYGFSNMKCVRHGCKKRNP